MNRAFAPTGLHFWLQASCIIFMNEPFGMKGPKSGTYIARIKVIVFALCCQHCQMHNIMRDIISNIIRMQYQNPGNIAIGHLAFKQRYRRKIRGTVSKGVAASICRAGHSLGKIQKGDLGTYVRLASIQRDYGGKA